MKTISANYQLKCLKVERRPSLRIFWYVVSGAKSKEGKNGVGALDVEQKGSLSTNKSKTILKKIIWFKIFRPHDSVNAGCKLL